VDGLWRSRLESQLRVKSSDPRDLRAWWRTLNYLTVAGCLRWRDYGIASAFVVAALHARFVAHSPNAQLVTIYLLIVPIVAGTGMLDAAREGRIDLLFASGLSRKHVWAAPTVRALFLHVCAAAVIAAISSNVGLVALLIVALCNAALGLAGGIVRPAATFGTVWLAARLGFALLPQTASLRQHMTAVNHGTEDAVAWKLLLTTFFAPESALTRNHLPSYVPLCYMAVAGLALYLSYRAFTRTAFTGRRRE
jgi:hypothetical protein